MSTNALISKAAKTVAKVPKSKSLDARERKLLKRQSELEAAYSELSSRRSNFLAVERRAKEACDQEMKRIKEELKGIEQKLTYDLSTDRRALALREKGYTALNWKEILSWKDETTGLPKLVLFSTRNSEFWFSAENRQWIVNTHSYFIEHQQWNNTRLLNRWHSFGKTLGEFYQKLMEPYFHRQLQHRTKVKLKATFTGVIPDEVRDIISTESQSENFDEILILAEVENWEQEVIDVDPLVLGRYGTYMFHLTQFDLTPTETAAMWEVDKRV